MVSQEIGIDGMAGPGQQVGDQALVARRVLPGDNHRMENRGVFLQTGLDLAELDPVATDLHLEVLAAQEVDDTIAPVAGQVTGAVEPGPGDRGSEPIGDEALLVQLGPLQVAGRHPVAADEQLASHADRAGLEIRVDHVHLLVPERRPIGTGPSPSSTRWTDDQIVVSVGP